MALTPRLTPFDERVLNELGTIGKRTGTITDAVVRPGRATRRAPTVAAEASVVFEVLRGLERVGLARYDCGWWRRA